MCLHLRKALLRIMGAVLLTAGARANVMRYPHARVMIHQPLGMVFRGQTSEVEIHAREILRMREELNGYLSFSQWTRC